MLALGRWRILACIVDVARVPRQIIINALSTVTDGSRHTATVSIKVSCEGAVTLWSTLWGISRCSSKIVQCVPLRRAREDEQSSHPGTSFSPGICRRYRSLRHCALISRNDTTVRISGLGAYLPDIIAVRVRRGAVRNLKNIGQRCPSAAKVYGLFAVPGLENCIAVARIRAIPIYRRRRTLMLFHRS